MTVGIRGFKDATGAAVDMSGVPFQVTFSDGSVTSFIP